MNIVSLSIGRDDLRTSRPPRLRARQDLLDQQTSLGQDGVVIAAEWPQNELRHPGVDIFGDVREDRISVTDHEGLRGVAAGALGVSLYRPADGGRVAAAEMEREAGAVVIFVDRSAGFGGGGLDRGHDASSLSRRVTARLPAGADARSAADRGVARATDPHRQIGLRGLRRHGDALQLVEGAAEVDLVLSPQAADDLEALVGLAAARLRIYPERLPFGTQWAADAEGRQQAAVR